MNAYSARHLAVRHTRAVKYVWTAMMLIKTPNIFLEDEDVVYDQIKWRPHTALTR